MINSNEGDLIGEIERAIAREYGWPGFFEAKEAIELAPGTLEKLVGAYLTASGTSYRIEKDGDKLFIMLNGQARIALSPKSETEFFVPFLNTEITFGENAIGVVTSLTILQEGNSITAERKL